MPWSWYFLSKISSEFGGIPAPVRESPPKVSRPLEPPIPESQAIVVWDAISQFRDADGHPALDGDSWRAVSLLVQIFKCAGDLRYAVANTQALALVRAASHMLLDQALDRDLPWPLGYPE